MFQSCTQKSHNNTNVATDDDTTSLEDQGESFSHSAEKVDQESSDLAQKKSNNNAFRRRQ